MRPVALAVTGPPPAPLAETTRWLLAPDGGPSGWDVADSQVSDSEVPAGADPRPEPVRERVESRHVGHLVVAAEDGTVVTALGDPDRVTFLRSTVKPFQATASLDMAGVDLPDDLVAVGWSSHRGEPVQRDAVTAILQRAGLRPADLTTPPSRPPDDESQAPTRLAHNCSGKHALFALAGRAVGVSGRALLDPEGPVQRTVLATLDRALGDVRAVAVDGCGAPAVAAPLVALARAYAALLDPDGPWQRAAKAGRSHPGLVGGKGRLESALLAAGVVAKPGAEGVFAAGWKDGGGRRWGLASKAEDGASRAVTAAVRAFLVTAEVVPADVWHPDPVLGGGEPAGAVRAAPAVHAAARSWLSRRA